MWVRGLKLKERAKDMAKRTVAPHVGAWIETQTDYSANGGGLSHPMWVRGLKHKEINIILREQESHPMWVRGLKQYQCVVDVVEW